MTSTPSVIVNESEKGELDGLTSSQKFQLMMKNVYVKAKKAPNTISLENAHHMFEHVEADDLRAARIILAIESYAQANETARDDGSASGQASFNKLMAMLNGDAIEMKSTSSAEALRSTEGSMNSTNNSVIQRSTSRRDSKAGNEEINPQTYKNIVVTKGAHQFDYLKAQSYDRSETHSPCQLPTEGDSSSTLASFGRYTPKSQSPVFPKQSRSNQNDKGRRAEVTREPSSEAGRMTTDGSEHPHSRDTYPHHGFEKSPFNTSTPFFFSKKRREALSDSSNISPHGTDDKYSYRREHSQHDKEMNDKLAGMSLMSRPKVEYENVVL